MTGPVDVLAVMDRQLEFTVASDYSGASDDHRDLLAARAAVAELIEECERLCKAADGMKRNAEGMSRKSPVAITLRTAAENILSLRPLLTNVGGAK